MREGQGERTRSRLISSILAWNEDGLASPDRDFLVAGLAALTSLPVWLADFGAQA
jgi:hypothetical protein